MDQPPAWLSWERSDLSGLEPDSLLWVSFESWPLITRTSPPPHSSQEPSDLSGIIQGEPHLTLYNKALKCIVGSINNPSYPPFNYSTKTVQLMVYVHLFFVPCIEPRFELFAFILFRIDDIWLLLSLCIIVIMDMYSRYLDTINSQHHHSESITIIRHKIRAWFWLSIGFPKDLVLL